MTTGRRLFFGSLALLLVLVAVEAGARALEWAFGGEAEPSRWVDPENPVPVFERVRVGGRDMYRRTSHHPLMLPNLEFPATKPPGAYRVFLLGGSAAAGWPYALGGYGLSDFLEAKLRMVWPHKDVRVLNLAGGTYASHRVRFVFAEVVDYEPDLILVYSGNNEFLEHFVFQRPGPPEPLDSLAMARIVHRALRGVAWGRPSFDVEGYRYADQRSNRLAYAFGRASEYREDPEQFEGLLAHYRNNIEAIVRTCSARNLPVALINVPVNLRDWVPNVSRHRADLTPAERERWQEHFRRGFLALEAGDAETAVAALSASVAIDPEYAEGHYRLGRGQLALGDFEAARASFVRALERDAYPFRALPEFQRVLREVASEHHVPLVDAVGALEARSPDGILGREFLIDYVHLTLAGLEEVAHAVLLTMRRTGWLPPPLAMRPERARVPVPDSFTAELDLITYRALYRQHLVMRQYDKLDATYEKLADAVERLAAEQPEEAEEARRRLAGARRLQEIVGRYRRLLRAEKLGLLEEEFTRDEANRIYTSYVRMIRRLEAPDMAREEFVQVVPRLDYREKRTPRRSR